MLVNVIKSVTTTAPVNIAVIKYWGKSDEDMIIPINSSLSATLDQRDLSSMTSIAASPEFTTDRIWLNGKEEDIMNKRLQKAISEIRGLALSKATSDEDKAVLNCKVHIVSMNNFPTAAGLASSASGYACLVFALANLYNVTGENLSIIARMGSGSACRSLDGGWVRWNKGYGDPSMPKDESTQRAVSMSSFAQQIADEAHWPEMEILILVVNDKKKGTSSTNGMNTSVETSALIEYRANHVVPKRLEEIELAILNKDFETFGRLTMQDSNQFHAICLDTYPPIFYMNDVSRTLVDMITKYNGYYKKVKAAYTFDAGPNAVIYACKESMREVMALINIYYKPDTASEADFYRGVDSSYSFAPLSSELTSAVFANNSKGTLQYAILTRPGPGPVLLSEDKSLIDKSTGHPID